MTEGNVINLADEMQRRMYQKIDLLLSQFPETVLERALKNLLKSIDAETRKEP